MDSKRKSKEHFTRSKMKRRKIQNSQTISVETIFNRFPKLTEDILGFLDKETLTNSVLVNETWRNVILNQRPYHIQYIQNCTKDCCKKKWKGVSRKMPFKLLKKLSGYTTKLSCNKCKEKKSTTRYCKCSCDSPIHLAAAYGDFELFQYLIVKTEDKNPENRYEQSPLHFASAGYRRSCLDICKWYIENGIDLNKIKDKSMSTPLHYAVRLDNLEVFSYLFENGADLYSKNRFGQTVLHQAAKNSSIKIANFIMMHYKIEDISIEDNFGRTPISLAVQQKSLDMVKLLFRSGGHFDTKTNQGNTLLHYSIDRDSKVAEFILMNVFDKNPANDIGDTPLHNAAEKGFMNACVTVCKYIPIEERNPKNNAGQTPMDLAYKNQNWEVVHFLMTENKFVNCQK